MIRGEHRALYRLATLNGAQIAYHDVARRRRHAKPEALLAVLRALGAPVATGNDVLFALRESEQMRWRRGLEPVAIAWDETPAAIGFRLPEDRASASLAAHLSLASGDVHTCDMPTFAAFWHGLDIDDRRQLGLLDRKGAALEWKIRKALKASLIRFLKREGRLACAQQDLHSLLLACLALLSSSPARALLVTLEDLWLETLPQNVPNTQAERPNSQRKTRHTFEVLSTMPQVVGSLQEIGLLRKQ